ncbi:MAG: response regulator [bacterium]|nr:response regulator [bacterium]
MKKTLVIENNIANQGPIRTMLCVNGYECDCVRNSIEALRNFKEDVYDLVLISIGSSEKNYEAIVKDIKKLRPNILVLAVTTIAVPQQTYGRFDHFISRAFTIATLKRV